MKVKTITCQGVYNAGAKLQTFALISYIGSLGHEVEVIDYNPDYLSQTYRIWSTHRKLRVFPLNVFYGVLMLPKKIAMNCSKRKKVYDEFTYKYIKTTKISYKNNMELINNLPESDIYIAGSDQIWNPNFQNGKDPAFFLDFVPEDKIKASYAASFATDRIPDNMKYIMCERIKRLDKVSVRENTGIELLKDMGIDEGAVQVLDPVFLLEKEQWLELVSKERVKEQYILVYDFENSLEIKLLAQKIAKEKKLKIYSVLKCDYADKSLHNFGPLEFVYYINNSDLVLSNSFHSTVFSIILNKEFLVMKREENLNTRMEDLLKIAGLSNRLVDENLEIYKLSEMINYTEVEEKLLDYKEKSVEFLKNILK